jgi:hypothetical protein
MQVYGMPIKSVIHEKFGDGIMSAIDFTLDVEKEEDPQRRSRKVIMSGQFLPTKSGNSLLGWEKAIAFLTRRWKERSLTCYTPVLGFFWRKLWRINLMR